jgi:hypothetical protein
MVNPEYLFYAYFQEKMNEATFKAKTLELASKVKGDLPDGGMKDQGFGGDLSAEKLMK